MKTPILLAALLLLPLIAPTGAATSQEDVFVFATNGGIIATVTYDDGLASTRMGFTQLEGASGGPGERFSPTAVCTEWIGVFTQLLVLARGTDHVATSEVRMFNVLASTPGAPTTRIGDHWTLDTMGAHAWRGSLLVCDDPEGPGLVRLNVVLVKQPFVPVDPALLRLTVEVPA